MDVFRPWVPEWLARGIIGSILIVSLLSFALYYSNMKSAMGYYGFEQVDIQYSVVLMYATVVTFLALDARLIKYFAARDYIVIGLILNVISYIICFYTKNFGVFIVCRFVQGAACGLLCSVVLNLFFPRFRKAKSKIYGYSIFYGGLQMSIPICAIYCSWNLYFIEFNYLFYGLSISILCIFVLVLISMNGKGRFQRKIPLYQVDWIGAFLYTLFCILLGYILVYGQKYNWFESGTFTILTLFTTITFILFVLRELYQKRPLINLRLFRYKKFIVGLALLTALYIFKGTIIFVYNYIETVLNVDSINMIPIWYVNMAGVFVGTFITARYIIDRLSLSVIIIIGFSMLALFHLTIYFTLSSMADVSSYYLPIFMYGLGTSLLFVPAVVFAVSSVPANLAGCVSPIGILARFVGFCVSMSLNNYFQLYTKGEAFDKFREYITDTNYMLGATLNNIRDSFSAVGHDYTTSEQLTQGYLDKIISDQLLLKSTMNYFGIIFISMVIFIVILIFSPTTKKVVIKIRRRFIPY